ncbi:MAG: hypothetical protein PVF76_09400, partial [Syntrophobacterales bacterium]
MLSSELETLIRRALDEDIGNGDITTACTVSPTAVGEGRIVAKEPLVLAGIEVARQVFWAIDNDLEIILPLEDGSRPMDGGLILE